MIKKINLALVVVFVVLFGFKFLLDAATAAKARKSKRGPAPVAVAEGVSTLAPRIYFTRWPPLFSPNVVTRHNGICLDIIQAVFPNAVLDDSKETSNIEVVKEILRTDPNAVVAEYADMEELREFPMAEEQVGWMLLCVYLPRTSTWKYQGPESLDKLRLAWEPENCDSTVLQNFAKKWKDTPGKAVICDTRDLGEKFWTMIEKGEIDGFVSSYGYAEISSVANDSKAFVRYRQSEPIDMLTLRFHASSVNPEFSKKLCDAFDDGVHRLYHAGVIHRLAEYYKKDFSDQNIAASKFPIDRYSEDQ